MSNTSYFGLAILLLSIAGCNQPPTLSNNLDSDDQSSPASVNKNEPDKEGTAAPEYIYIFDKDHPQNVISNRMVRNLENSVNDNDNAESEKHHFRSAGLLVEIPEGTKLSKRFTGFIGELPDSEGSCNFTVLTNPFSITKVTKGLVSSSVRNGVTKILYNQQIQISGRQGEFYVTLEPFAWAPGQEPVDVAKFILVFGDEEFCWIVSCSFKPEHESSFAAPLLRCLLNVQVSEEPRLPPGEDVDFEMNGSRLKATDGFIDKYVFTRDGIFDVDDSQSPVFQAQRSVMELEIEDKKTFARSLISPGPDFAIDHISSEKSVTIGGLQGFEFLSVGSDSMTNVPLWIYTVVLFDKTNTYIMHGWTSSDNEQNYVEDFRELANSFKLKEK